MERVLVRVCGALLPTATFFARAGPSVFGFSHLIAFHIQSTVRFLKQSETCRGQLHESLFEFLPLDGIEAHLWKAAKETVSSAPVSHVHRCTATARVMVTILLQ